MNNLTITQLVEETEAELARLGITKPTQEQVKAIQKEIRAKHEVVVKNGSNPQWGNS